MATRHPQPMSLAEFLHWDDGTDRRYALIRRRPVATAPPSGAHAVILSNTGAALKQRVRPPYYVAAEVGVVPPERDDTYYQADVAVSCTPTPATAQYLVDPVLIVEVLSPSTAAHDRTQKLPDYRRIASVQEIVLVSSQERRVEIWRRKGGNGRSRTRSAKRCCVDSIRVDLPVGAIYEDVDLMPEADAR